VGITSPTKGCGKSFVSVNLAVSLSRYKHCRTVLLDMDLRLPTIARKLGVRYSGAISEFLRGSTPPEAFLQRVSPGQLHIGQWLAVGLNSQSEAFASELFFDEATGTALARMEQSLDPRIVLLDLPPVLAQDDVLALTPHLDCVLLVAGGGSTTARELLETSRRLGDTVPILAVVLNKAEGEDIMDYSY
jgi:Mrp family chromosome partitioning ATPase